MFHSLKYIAVLMLSLSAMSTQAGRVHPNYYPDRIESAVKLLRSKPSDASTLAENIADFFATEVQIKDCDLACCEQKSVNKSMLINILNCFCGYTLEDLVVQALEQDQKSFKVEFEQHLGCTNLGKKTIHVQFDAQDRIVSWVDQDTPVQGNREHTTNDTSEYDAGSETSEIEGLPSPLSPPVVDGQPVVPHGELRTSNQNDSMDVIDRPQLDDTHSVVIYFGAMRVVVPRTE